MLIAGFNKTSFVDYPGKLCAVVFTPYCNMRCWYCHNRHILSGEQELFDEDAVFAYLTKRRDVLQGVVITGGEPTLRPDLPLFAEKVKTMGYCVKLDTNGTNPKMLASMIERKLIDYVAMDIKAPREKYAQTAGANVDLAAVEQSIRMLIGGTLPYEFRTTFAPTLTQEDILDIAKMIPGAKAYFLQQYRPNIPRQGENPALVQPPAHPPQYVRETAALMEQTLGVCGLRGV